MFFITHIVSGSYELRCVVKSYLTYPEHMSQKINLQDPATLVAVISSLCANDTAVIRKAEKALKPFTKKVESIPMLINLVQSSQDVNIRHHSALLLKKGLGTLYSKCTPQQRDQLKTTLLSLVVSESVKAVRTALAGYVFCLCLWCLLLVLPAALLLRWPKRYSHWRRIGRKCLIC